MFSFLDDEIMAILNIIKEDVDAKVYDRNDIFEEGCLFQSYCNVTYQWMFVSFPSDKA